MLIETATDGNCGIDVMAHWTMMSRNHCTWLALRRELSQFMLQNRNKTLWQQAFTACQEYDNDDANRKSDTDTRNHGGMGPPAEMSKATHLNTSLCTMTTTMRAREPMASSPIPMSEQITAQTLGKDARMMPVVLASGSSSTHGSSNQDVPNVSDVSEVQCYAAKPAVTNQLALAVPPPLPPPDVPPPAGLALADWVSLRPEEERLQGCRSHAEFLKLQERWRLEMPLSSGRNSQTRLQMSPCGSFSWKS